MLEGAYIAGPVVADPSSAVNPRETAQIATVGDIMPIIYRDLAGIWQGILNRSGFAGGSNS